MFCDQNGIRVQVNENKISRIYTTIYKTLSKLFKKQNTRKRFKNPVIYNESITYQNLWNKVKNKHQEENV